MKEYIYDGTTAERQKLAELQKQGYKIICPKCKSELIVALDTATAARKGVHPGVYCPVNEKHMKQLISVMKVDWKKIKG